jgi:hypothetical protein
MDLHPAGQLRRDVTVVGDDGDSGAFLVQPVQQGEDGAADRTLPMRLPDAAEDLLNRSAT